MTYSWTPLDVLISLAEPQQHVDPAFPPPPPPPLDTFSTRSLTLFTEFARQMQTLQTMAYQEPLEVLLRSVIDTMELMPHFNKTSKSKREFEDRKQNVEELQQAAQKCTDRGSCLVKPSKTGKQAMKAVVQESTLSSFLDDVALVTDLAERSTDEGFVVNLMTIHASKGKEFDTVFVVGNEDGTFPTSQAIQMGERSTELDEEKRLCYVAMTRAKTELYMTRRNEVRVFTKDGIRTITRHCSRFLNILVGDEPIEQDAPEPKRIISRRLLSNSSSSLHIPQRFGSGVWILLAGGTCRCAFLPRRDPTTYRVRRSVPLTQAFSTASNLPKGHRRCVSGLAFCKLVTPLELQCKVLCEGTMELLKFRPVELAQLDEFALDRATDHC